ncbi:hypothetical protein MBLNU459_g1162t2 [Dothideomycetes sp. NU459]
MDRNNSYRSSHDDSRESRRGYYDSYPSRAIDRPPPPRYDDAPPPPQPAQSNRDADMFHFRGAANRPSMNDNARDFYRPSDRPAEWNSGGDNYRSAEGRTQQANGRAFDFNFRAGDAPSFPSDRGVRPQQSGRESHRNAGKNPRRGGRGGAAGRGRGAHSGPYSGPRFVRRAGDRALLRTKREPTPEQLEGMNDGESRFKVLEDLSDSESEAMDISDAEASDVPLKVRNDDPLAAAESDGSEDEHPRSKRARVHSPTAEAASADTAAAKPKWSNPDPYTVLPCPDGTETRKGKDVVKLIRKAKVDASKSEAQSSTASDFISLNFDDDTVSNEEGEVLSLGSDSENDDARRANAQSSFSHLNHLHPDRVTAPSSFTPVNTSLQPGRLDVWPPPPVENDLSVRDEYDQALHKQEANDTSATIRKQSKKRKHMEVEQELGDVVEEWLSLDNVDPTPWLDIEAPGWPKLHYEIRDFYNYVKPRDFEGQVRRHLIDRVQQAISFKFPEFKILAFGSYASGLYLPTADMDLVACSRTFLNGQAGLFITKSMMYKFGRCLEDARIIEPQSLTVISGARVPIIKFVERTTGLRFDISFENDSGLQAQKTFTKWTQDYPEMPVIVSLVKQFLVMRGMSEVFQGGLGGYSVICLVVSVIRHLKAKRGSDWAPKDHLDTILMEFLVHYGKEFDFKKHGIQMEPWSYIKKSKWNPAGSKKPKMDRLLIIDPNKYNNDISGGSSQIELIFDMFHDAFQRIEQNLNEVEELYQSKGEKTSILDCVWGGNYEVFELQRARMKKVWSNIDMYGNQPANQSSLAGEKRIAKQKYDVVNELNATTTSGFCTA